MNNPYTGEEIRVYTNDEIDIRDTYVLPWEGKYYLYGTQGFEAFKGTAIAYNDEGNIRGPFVQENELITPPNMGHVNLFETFDGQLMLATHYPDDDENGWAAPRPSSSRSSTMKKGTRSAWTTQNSSKPILNPRRNHVPAFT